jgi:flavin reductase
MKTVEHPAGQVGQVAFRNSMSRLGSAVSVVTTVSGGKRYGFTASAVCSVSDSPATILVCINRASATFPAFATATHFCINTLMPGQEDLSEAFGGRAPAVDRFALGEWSEGVTGVPVLNNASVSFECALSNAVDEATHRILFGRVIDIREHKKRAALLYCMRRYLAG